MQHATLWRRCAAACALAVSIAAPSAAQTNPPKLDKQLQSLARKFGRSQYGPVVQNGASVGPGRLNMPFEPASGVDPAAAEREP